MTIEKSARIFAVETAREKSLNDTRLGNSCTLYYTTSKTGTANPSEA
jgi:hypothetical protein